VAALVAGVLALPGMAAATPGAPAPEPTEPVGPASAPAATRSGSTLSPRLEELADRAGARTSDAGQATIAGLPADGPGSLLRGPDGSLRVNARLTELDAAARARLERAGADVVATAADQRLVTLSVEPTELDALRTADGVEWVEEVLAPFVGTGARPVAPAQAAPNATCGSRVISEADTQLLVAGARSTYGLDGSGVKVGILSDSFDHLGGAATDVADGELPGPGNPCGWTNPVVVQADATTAQSDEGRGMAQLVHDLAPGAELSFATAFNSDLDFADQIRGLADAGARVIVDDISYFNEPIYQDGIISAAVNDVTAAGVTYWSSAGNGTLTIGGKSVASYETAAYRPVPCPAAVAAPPFSDTDCHDFNPAAGIDNGNVFTIANNRKVQLKLGYDEPQYGLTTDLDLFLLDADTGAVVASSVVDNVNASKQAYELVSHTNSTGAAKSYKVVVGRFGSGGATPRFKTIHLNTSGISSVQWNTSTGGDVMGPSTYGHNANRVAGSIAAVPYDNSATVEGFSSQGPARYCWEPVSGTEPAAALATCQVKNLDVAATDGAANSFFGQLSGSVHRFYGTSAAAPHAAAIGALQLEHRPCSTPAKILAAQRASGRSVGSFGLASVGSGLIDAGDAVSNLATCLAVPEAPTGVTAVAGSGSATVSWSAPPFNGGAVITNYVVTPAIDGVPQAPRTFPAGPLTQVVTGLEDGAPHTFTVAAVNVVGTGPESTPSSPPVTPRSAPGAPSGATATGGTLQATVSWTPPTVNGGSTITGYRVTPYVGATIQTPVDFASTATTQVITGLTAGTTYTFRVSAKNAIGVGLASDPTEEVTPRSPWSPFTSWGAMVDRIHADLLGRPPTASQRTGWVADLSAGDVTPGGMVAALRADPDQVGNVDPVTRLYRAYFLRIPDRGGLVYWIGRRRGGRSLSSISSTFAGSNEFKTRYGTLGNKAFVELVYANVLGRPGDTAGINFWTNQLNTGRRTRGLVMIGFSESSEFRRTSASETTAAVLPVLLLGRSPTAAEFANVVAALDGTGTPAMIADFLIASDEYAGHVQG
jgi:hypothetical protein